ncbi:transcription factor bHLH126 isoform X1 [Jatropha curcas]|uniref:transcription factor bHLH126 isoform X1 n=1 Tax=Jatropha curcas TaxID=180498 RepID=UPI0009D6D29A|nr:transcription factor bHLH126 isoform X1 [Jatropha curcas]
MFPFQQNNELSSQISSNYPNQDIVNPLILDYQFTSLGTSNYLMEDGLQQPSITLPSSNPNNDKKKIVRKEIERQRRQQMSTLQASLRSLLPHQSLQGFVDGGMQGKRSMSDHVNEAAKYIKHLESNVQELSAKRDKLKNLTCVGDQEEGNQSTVVHNNSTNATVSVWSHVGGVEVVISSDSGEETFLLSTVLEALLEEGFDIVCCISTNTDGRLYSTIQCQASHETCIDPTTLQQKLNDVILK